MSDPDFTLRGSLTKPLKDLSGVSVGSVKDDFGPCRFGSEGSESVLLGPKPSLPPRFLDTRRKDSTS